ncbi:MAG: DinB family protein [Vicinamibacteraceae bacterium]
MIERRWAQCLAAVLVVAAVSVSGQAPPPPRPPQTYPIYLQGQYASIKRYVIGAAEKMPAEHFAFKPVPEVMSYAQLLGHIIDVQYGFCHAVKGGDNPATGRHLDTLADKAALVPAVKDAFAYCDDAFAGLTSENALQLLTIGKPPTQWQSARANELTMVIAHGNEHYGNLVTYLRIKGIVPPSSTPQ